MSEGKHQEPAWPLQACRAAEIPAVSTEQCSEEHLAALGCPGIQAGEEGGFVSLGCQQEPWVCSPAALRGFV